VTTHRMIMIPCVSNLATQEIKYAEGNHAGLCKLIIYYW